MVLASHVIFGAYGFWLPNDPRGSWSDFVGSWELFRFGSATKTNERRSLAWRPHHHAARLAAKSALKRQAVQFDDSQRLAIGAGFQSYAQRSGLIIWACSIMPEHVHLILARHRLKVEQLVIQLKGRATEQLVGENRHPFPSQLGIGPPPKCFARSEWKVYLESDADIQRGIRYVEENPEKEGMPRQTWPFVTPFKGID